MIRKAALCLLLSLPAAVYARYKADYRVVSIPNKNITLSGTPAVPPAYKPIPAVDKPVPLADKSIPAVDKPVPPADQSIPAVDKPVPLADKSIPSPP